MLKSVLVKDYMTADPLAFHPDMEVLGAIHQLLEHRLSGAPVVDRMGQLVGFLSEKDCLKVALSASYYEERGGQVSQFMTPSVVTIDADSSLTDAVDLFVNRPFHCLPVVRDARLIGQLTRHDALRALETLW
jgi:CBS domain-containing protein